MIERLKNFSKSYITGLGLVIFAFLTILILKNEIVQIHNYWVNLIGPTIYVLFPMAVILISVIFLLVFGEMDERFPSVREIRLIEEGAPIIGLLGTVIALVKGFSKLDLTQAADASIQVMIKTISESLYATPTGLSLGLLAWFVRNRFIEK